MKSKIIKYSLSIASAVILGAFGSALWEIALRPLLFFLIDFFMDLYSHYFDNVYRYVATGGNYLSNVSSVYFFVIFMLILTLGPTRFRRCLEIIAKPFPIGIIFYVFLGYILVTRTYYDSTARSTLRDIEIVAPYIYQIKNISSCVLTFIQWMKNPTI